MTKYDALREKYLIECLHCGIMVDAGSVWWKRAVRDMEIAESNFGTGFFDAASFYAQQSAEKALKAVLADDGAPPRVHDLRFLARKVKAPLPIVEAARRLDPVYMASRYPDAPAKDSDSDFDEKRARAMIRCSKEVLTWVSGLLSAKKS